MELIACIFKQSSSHCHAEEEISGEEAWIFGQKIRVPVLAGPLLSSINIRTKRNRAVFPENTAREHLF